jgi:glycosyltransferase involved in cell wall biosynthesis
MTSITEKLPFATKLLVKRAVVRTARILIEAVSQATDWAVASGLDSNRLRVVKELVDKWRVVLARENLHRNTAQYKPAANQKEGPNILVVDDRVPMPDRDAGGERMFLILQSLATWARPVFVSLGRPLWAGYEEPLLKEGIEIASPLDYKKLIEQRKFQVAILSRPNVGNAVFKLTRRTDPHIKIIFDTVDLSFLRLEREYQLTGNRNSRKEAVRYRKIEARLARSADQTWCVTPEDKDALFQEVPSAKIEIVPTLHPLRGRGKPFAEREGLIFVGNFLHRPNADAMRHFVREIYPLVQRSIPAVKLYVVGSDPPVDIANNGSSGIVITGQLPDIESLLQSCRVFVAPLRYGAGMKGKVGLALSHGLPVVTTPIGAEGYDMISGEQALIADSPEAFAREVIRVYTDRDLWQRLSDVGYLHIQANFTPEVLADKIHAAIISLGEPARAVFHHN